MIDVIEASAGSKRIGKKTYILCPFHDDHKPSLNVSDNGEAFHCFGCGKSGHISELRKALGIADRNAKKNIPKHRPVSRKPVRINPRNQFLRSVKVALDSPYFQEMIDYCQKRHVSHHLARECGMLYSPKNNFLVFQYLTYNSLWKYGDMYQFLEPKKDQPKYLIQKGFQKSLCFYNEIDLGHPNVILVEGIWDCLSLYTNYLEKTNVGVVALSGASLSPRQANKLRNKKVYVMLDPDKAGIEGGKKIKEALRFISTRTEIINLQEHTGTEFDVNDLIIKGNEDFAHLISEIITECKPVL